MENEMIRNQKVFVRLADVLTLQKEIQRLLAGVPRGGQTPNKFGEGLARAAEILQLPVQTQKV